MLISLLYQYRHNGLPQQSINLKLNLNGGFLQTQK
jgi:hypothetical protein